MVQPYPSPAPDMSDMLCTEQGSSLPICPANGYLKNRNYLGPMLEAGDRTKTLLGMLYAHVECASCTPAVDCRLCVVSVTNRDKTSG
jgi:hypothetical protein